MNNDALPRGLFFLAGAASGLALGLYLHSDKGSALREQLTEHWEDLLENLGERAQEQFGELLSSLNAALEKGLLFVDDLEQQMEEGLETTGAEADDFMEDAEASFEQGMDRAKARLRQKFNDAGLAS